ncbi:hypothetical protein FOCC_FOCC005459 [Frankliniella occidentalis]|nr:hypothetical protein FOCC_FOCC005459 [Frankliniella occidentalis]
MQCSLDPIDVRQGPPYICPRCGRKYNWRQSFHRHVNMECAQAKRYQCNLCSYCNTRKDSFLLHLRRKHKLTSRDLPDLCRPTWYAENNLLEDASTSVDHNFPYVCVRCGRGYNWPQSLHRHLTTECDQIKKFKCPHCPYRNTRKDNLDSLDGTLDFEDDKAGIVMGVLGDDKDKYKESDSNECVTCGKVYRHRRHLQRHQRYECGGGRPRFRCPICYQSYIRPEHLKRHGMQIHKMKISTPLGTKKDPALRTASGGSTSNCPGSPPGVGKDSCKQYECPKCGRNYMWKNTLMRHLRNECGKEPQFQCPFCPHRTKLKSNLTQHIRYKHMPASS